MRRGPIGLHQPGRSLVHRLPPGAKLLGLLVFTFVAVLTDTVPATLAVLAGACALTVVARLGGGALWGVVRGFGVVAVLLFAFQAWQNGIDRGVVVAGGLFAVVLAATVVTATTPVDGLLDIITAALRPLRRFGVRPTQIALAFSLVLRTLPLMTQLAGETRDAARARGVERRPRAYLTPLVLRAVADARDTGAALHARGLGDD